MHSESFIMWFVIGMSSLSTTILFLANRSRTLNIIVAIALIAVSVAMVFMLSDFLFVVDNAKSITATQAKILQSEKFAANFWLLVFPTVFGGLGINMLSSHLQPPTS